MGVRTFLAGLSIGGLMLPEAVAYAGIAGLPPQRAILAGIAGSLAYLVLGRSRFAVVSPTSSSAAILAAALATLPGQGDSQLVLVTILTAMVGAAFSLAAAARLGGLASFVSRPVLRGFAFGLAITIIIKELPAIAGLDVHEPNIAWLAFALLAGLPQWHGYSVATGVIALAALLGLRRLPGLPGAFLVLVGGVAASIILDLPAHGVKVVGLIDMIPQWSALALPDVHVMSRLLQLTVPLFLIVFAESWGTMRSLALRHGDMISPNQELGALGMSNLAAAAAQGMPVGAGFSAGSAADAAGTDSRWAGLVAAGTLATLVLLGGSLVAQLPEPVLAAVVVAALTHALDPAPLLRLWRIRRDIIVAVGAALGVLLLGVLNGMLFAIALSLAVLIRRLAMPQLARLGRLVGTRDFVDMARHPDAAAPAGVAIWRPAEPLFFANAERILSLVDQGQRQDRGIRSVILSLEESFDLDSTALEALLEFDKALTKRGVHLRLARVRDHVLDLFRAAGADDLISRCSYSVDDAVTANIREVP